MSNKGRFIAIEGLDGAGTTTQTQMLTYELQARGHEVWPTGEPTCGPIGSLIRQILQGRVTGGKDREFSRNALALLFAADRLDHCETGIKPMINKGVTVISDRYVYSSFAYQTQNASRQWIGTINKFAMLPDLVVFLDISPDVAMQRVMSRGDNPEIFETLNIQKRVRQLYLQAMKRIPQQQKLIIPGDDPPDVVNERIVQAVIERFGW